MKTFTGKEEKINGVWYPVTIKADDYREALKKAPKKGMRKSYGIIEAVKGRMHKQAE